MANDNHLSSVTCYNVTMISNNYYNDFFELGQQKINFNFFELHLPDDDPVYTLKKVMEEMDLLCERDLAFIWLAKGQRPKRDAFYDFKGEKLTPEILDDLHYQFLRRLEKEGLVTLKELFIDGTKIEANANRYTFVWRGSINYHLAGLLDAIDALYKKYNSFLAENGYDTKYELGNAQMFIIEGMDKVREVIEKNRSRKLTKHKKLSNNTLIPVLEKHKTAFGSYPEAATADSGYCSEKNLLFLKANSITSYIKLQDHEKRKTRAYAEDIGKYYNMKRETYEDEVYYVCHDGRELHHIRTETKKLDGYEQTFEVDAIIKVDTER